MNNDGKFKLLYELSNAEYKDELERSDKINVRATHIFTVLNVAFPLLVGVVLRDEFWRSLKDFNYFVIGVLCFLVLAIFSCLISAWYRLFEIFRNRKVRKIDLVNGGEFEDVVYDDNKDLNYLYWKLHKTFQALIKENEKNI